MWCILWGSFIHYIWLLGELYSLNHSHQATVNTEVASTTAVPASRQLHRQALLPVVHPYTNIEPHLRCISLETTHIHTPPCTYIYHYRYYVTYLHHPRPAHRRWLRILLEHELEISPPEVELHREEEWRCTSPLYRRNPLRTIPCSFSGLCYSWNWG